MTDIVAIDCEMNDGLFQKILCKVTIINDKGELIVDTLVRQYKEEIKMNHFNIHGIPDRFLEDAPTFEEVKAHIHSICKNCIFVGHSVKHDLNVIKLAEV